MKNWMIHDDIFIRKPVSKRAVMGRGSVCLCAQKSKEACSEYK